MKKRPEGQGSQRAASVCRRPGAQHHVYAAERCVRWFCGRGAGPQRPRTGSPNGVRSAGTGERESTSCWRDGPVAAQRSSGSSRRQRESHLEWSPFRARPSEARSRLVRGASNVQSRRAEAVSLRSASPPMARRLMGEPLGGGREQARIACGGGAKRCPAGGRSRGVGRGRGWRDACCEYRTWMAQPVMSCAKRCRRHDSRKRVRVGGVLCKACA